MSKNIDKIRKDVVFVKFANETKILQQFLVIFIKHYANFVQPNQKSAYKQLSKFNLI